MPQPAGDVTGLLLAWGEGRRDALDQLMPLVYETLHRLAHGAMKRELVWRDWNTARAWLFEALSAG